MNENANVVVRLFLDALDDLMRAVDDLAPAAAQTRPGDRLNSISWVVAHVAQHMDSWVNVAIGQKARTEFLGQPQFSTGGDGVPPDWASVLVAVTQVVGNARSSVQDLDSAVLTTGIP